MVVCLQATTKIDKSQAQKAVARHTGNKSGRQLRCAALSCPRMGRRARRPCRAWAGPPLLPAQDATRHRPPMRRERAPKRSRSPPRHLARGRRTRACHMARPPAAPSTSWTCRPRPWSCTCRCTLRTRGPSWAGPRCPCWRSSPTRRSGTPSGSSSSPRPPRCRGPRGP